ncbi:MAG: M48 family metalloprotease [Candidatus Heimdallarchaeota archaeon]|nr:M48 family metalloprotease [Candidatus Heimdallarchaeota archaeon]MCK4955042.1 M48 family metalloprotease [Candidatus Heimdallarchaeota archaeon]
MKFKIMFRGMLTLAFLWGMVYGVVIAVIAIVYWATDGGLPEILGSSMFVLFPILITVGIVILQFLISPWLLDLNFRWLHRMSWIDPMQLPPHLAQFIADQSQLHDISIKKIGMIHDQMPTALTYGRFKKNARLVISDGILNLLTPEEQIAVVGHELGHIAHRDFLFMTIASAVPMIMYTFYIFSRGFLRVGLVSGGRNNRAAAAIATAAVVTMVVTYLFYIVSQFLVMFLSRIREYYADRFSGEQTRNPKGLSTALVKIAYGMVQTQAQTATAAGNKKADRRTRVREYRRLGFTNATRSLNIFDIKAANGLVMTAYAQSTGGDLDSNMVVKAAAWDLESPWGTFLELQSTHPLAAKRLLALDDLAEEMGIKRAYPTLGTDQIKETLWDEFLVDLFLMYAAPALLFILPGIGALSYLYGQTTMWMWIGIGSGCGLAALIWIWRTIVRYPKLEEEIPLIQIMGAVTDTSDDGYAEASPFRGKPINLQGTIIGRGTPGYYFSEDVVLQDPSGIITLDYNPLFGFMRWITALFRVDRLIGSQVTVVGWYRRTPRPIVMIKRMYTQDGKKLSSNRDWANWILVVLLFIAALFCIFYGIPNFLPF